MDYSPPGSSVLGILQARILEWAVMPSSRDLPNPGTEPRSPALPADSLPTELQGKPMNTGMGSLSLLQGIFPTQDLLYCRRILYQLSYQGSPGKIRDVGLISGSGRSPGGGQPTPVFLPGESHGWRNLVGYSPQGHKELDMTG